jgi:hypothetical protein
MAGKDNVTIEELLGEFSCRIYEAPLTEHRDSGRIADLSDPISILMLLVDFETEVSMNGICDFIGNSTGLYARETVEALKLVGCTQDAAVLSQILDIADRAGMTHNAIQADRSGLQEYAITSFAELHGDKWDSATEEIGRLVEAIDFERVMKMAVEYAARHEAALIGALSQSGRRTRA